MTSLAHDLSRLLDLDHPPVAVTFHDAAVQDATHRQPAPVPAGCCFWAPAEAEHLHTTAADHASCSVGSYTHGFIDLQEAAGGEDTAALVDSGWVTEVDLGAAPTVAQTPAAITYGPLRDSEPADVVLMRLSASSLMALQGACPHLALVSKPQCQIVPLALAGDVVVSPGCAVSRARTGLPAGELTCALPAAELATIVERLERSRAADATVTAYADTDLRQNFSRD